MKAVFMLIRGIVYKKFRV